MKKECPYCREGLEEQDAFYLLHWTREDEATETEKNYKALTDFLKEFSAISDRRKMDRFYKVWKNYNYEKIEDLPFAASEMILSREEVGELRGFLDHPEKPYKKIRASRLSALPSLEMGVRNEELLRTHKELPAVTENAAVEENEAEGKHYFYQKKNPEDEFDYQMDISYGTQDHIIIKVRRVCHNCYNVIPDELYMYDVVKVFLAAPPSSGKTSMLYSIFLNQDTFNRENGRYMTWESIQDISVEAPFKEFLNRAEKYKKNPREIDPTKVVFIPPLFLKFRYSETGSERIVILALYDNGGELFLDDSHENAKLFGELFSQKIKGMDAVLCLVSPESKERNDSRYGLGLKDEEIDRVLSASRILGKEEQRKAEENPLAEETTIGQLLEEMSARDKQNEQSSREVLKRLEQRLGGEAAMRQIAKEKYLGLIVSKIDYLSQSSLFRDEERKLFFEDAPCYFSDEEKYRKVERDKKMMDMLEDDLLVEYDLGKFRTYGYHFIAAFVEEQRRFHPIRVEEPLIEIVRDYFRQE